MTDVVRVIDGVPVVAMLDQSTDSGEIAQVGFDYFALDKDGNVWIMGGYTEDFEGGEYTNVETAWLGTATGGDPGILMPGVVTIDTPRWYIGTSGPDENPSVAEPVSVGVNTTVEFGDTRRRKASDFTGCPRAGRTGWKSSARAMCWTSRVPWWCSANLVQHRFRLMSSLSWLGYSYNLGPSWRNSHHDKAQERRYAENS